MVEHENRTMTMGHEMKIQSETVDVLSGKLDAVENETKDHLNTTFEDRMREFESLLSEIAEAAREACQAMNSSCFIRTSPRMKIEVSHKLNQLFSKAVDLHQQQEYYSDSSVDGIHFSYVSIYKHNSICFRRKLFSVIKNQQVYDEMKCAKPNVDCDRPVIQV